ncbi:hypothetical protein LAUMK4_00878 [Mycobacterium persicum]|uniref:Uncharacterized protein n=1 Tax=Mycobacterium persicum TaxID=1487726 RepID=A0AB38UPI9_9MYCO|nr:hypothetical protein LAUMK15_01232 [Mycobacterium persicum]VAZ82281.1 hypothetical protein LAUMK42_01088 [Mycobacterium persicum]VAZ88808.1 hypothetical protein LAUMK4_00878 [Mycobacterium persicum]
MRGEFRHTHDTNVDAADGMGRADRVDLRHTVSATDHMAPHSELLGPPGSIGSLCQIGEIRGPVRSSTAIVDRKA